MSSHAMKWAWEVSEVALDKTSDLTVLLALAEHASPTGRCWPSMKTIARMAKCSEGTVVRRLRDFEQMGLLAVFDRFCEKTGRQTSNEYRLAVTRPAADFVRAGGAKPGPREDEIDDAAGPEGEGEGSKLNPGEGSKLNPSEGVTMNPGGGVNLSPGRDSPDESPRTKKIESNTPISPAGGGIGGRRSYEQFAEAHPHADAFGDMKARTLFAMLTDEETQQAVETAGEYAKRCTAGGHRGCKAEHFLRTKMFTDKALKPEPKAPSFTIVQDTEQWAAWDCYSMIFRRTGLPTFSKTRDMPTEWPAIGRGLPKPGFHGAPPPGWVMVRIGSVQWFRWREFFRDTKPEHWRDEYGTPQGGADSLPFPHEWPPGRQRRGADASADDAARVPNDDENFLR